MNDLAIVDSSSALFARLSLGILGKLSESSVRIYQDAFGRWESWCAKNGKNPLEITQANVQAFLVANPRSKSAQGIVLTGLRQVLEHLAILYPDQTALQLELRLVKAMRIPPQALREGRGHTQALTPDKMRQVLHVWKNDTTPLGIRNHALVCVLFSSWLRRFELKDLTWNDVNWEQGTLHIAHGKGDKEAWVEVDDWCLDALWAWGRCMHQSLETERIFIFPRVLKGGHLGPDEPITGDAVWRVAKETGKRCGFDWHPHMARASGITDALNMDTPMHHVQGKARHSNPETTLGYARTLAAAQRRRNQVVRSSLTDL